MAAMQDVSLNLPGPVLEKRDVCEGVAQFKLMIAK